MLELVFTVCSIVSGAACHELKPLPLEPNAGLLACSLASQFEAAKWTEANPNYYVTRATCQPSRLFAKV